MEVIQMPKYFRNNASFASTDRAKNNRNQARLLPREEDAMKAEIMKRGAEEEEEEDLGEGKGVIVKWKIAATGAG